jgi:hypothetical protein
MQRRREFKTSFFLCAVAFKKRRRAPLAAAVQDAGAPRRNLLVKFQPPPFNAIGNAGSILCFMKNSFFKIGLRLAAFQLGLLLCQNLPAAQPVFTITPTAVSNTYIGTITFQIIGIPTGHTVVIQKFGDVVTNGAIAAGDALVQQFNLTDNQTGMVIGGVTNVAVPFDYNSQVGTITAALGFPNGDFSQKIVGQYGFVLSSPVGDFTPITNLFTVTNFPYAQKITGNIVNSGTNVPYASVILFPAPRPGHDLGTPVAGAVANNLGAYSIQVPPGTYVPMAFKSNFVASYSASPVVTLTSSQTVTTNLTLTNATASISGKVVDALNTSIVLPGLFVPANNTNYLIATGSTDTNGNFTIRVTSGQWQISGDPDGLGVHGYVGYNDGTNVNAGTTGFVGGFYKATSLFYGTVKDGSGNPLQGIPIEARDQPNNGDGEFDTDGYEDTNGNYTVVAYGGLGSGDPWVVDVDNQSQFPNYVFSQPALDQNGGTNLAAGQVVQANFTALVATNQITGNVKFNGTNVVGVGVSAYATINSVNYNLNNVDTDTNGNYSLTVANGNWSVYVNDCGCGDDDSLNQVVDGGTNQGNYQDPISQNVTIANNNGTANFTVPFCGGVSIITPSPLPNGTNGVSYYIQLQASGCNNNFTWNLNDPADFPPGLSFDNAGEIYNTPSASGTYHFSVNVSDGNGHSTNQSFTLFIAQPVTPLQIMTASLPNGTNGTFYSQTLQASGGQTPYGWSLAPYSSSLPPNLTLTTNGVLSGTLATNGTFYFYARVTDATGNYVDSSPALQLYLVNPPLQITTASLPNGVVGVAYSNQLAATGGYPPYSWSLAAGSAALPANLNLGNNGVISGVPATNGTFNFLVQVYDGYTYPYPTKPLTLIINGQPLLGSPIWLTNRFQMRLIGAANQNYTIQASTNLSSANWTTLFITNNSATNSFIVVDPSATNNQRFYRTLIGP